MWWGSKVRKVRLRKARHRGASVLAVIGGCLGVYVVLAVAFHWFIQPSFGKRSPAPALSAPAAAPAAVARSDGAAPPTPQLVAPQAPAPAHFAAAPAHAVEAPAAPAAGSVDIAAAPAPSVVDPPTKPAPPTRKIRRQSQEQGWFDRASRVY
jgi:amino acid transporter